MYLSKASWSCSSSRSRKKKVSKLLPKYNDSCGWNGCWTLPLHGLGWAQCQPAAVDGCRENSGGAPRSLGRLQCVCKCGRSWAPNIAASAPVETAGSVLLHPPPGKPTFPGRSGLLCPSSNLQYNNNNSWWWQCCSRGGGGGRGH